MGNSPGVGIFFIKALEYPVENQPYHDSHDKEENRVQYNLSRIGVGTLEADNEGQHNNADNIVDYGGAENGSTYPSLELSHLFKRLHRNADAGGSHNHADKHRLIKLFRPERSRAVKAHVQQGTAHQGDENSRTGNEKGNGSCLHQLL